MKFINQTGSFILHHAELEFTSKLGSGTSGTVYKGLYRTQPVAIKVLKTEQSNKELEEFKKEFQIMGSIQSPFLVFFFGACTQPRLCMVMELCARGSLYHVMKDNSIPFTWDLAFNIMIEMTKGMDVLHTSEPNPVVHRDFKSLNLMVNDSYHVKVGDFRLSRFITETMQATLGKLRGTFAYSAPEIYHGELFTPKSDVFSIGMVIWEIMQRVLTEEYQQPWSEYPNLQRDFQIIIHCAKKNLRPTIPSSCPQLLADIIQDTWKPKGVDRPSCQDLLERFEVLKSDYVSNRSSWENALKKNN